MDIKNLYKLEKKDIDKSADILTKAFYNYPMFKYILGDKHNEENTKIVLKFLIKYAVLYGEAYANSPKLEGIILFSDYKDYNFSFFRSIRAGGLALSKLGAETGKRFSEYDNFLTKIHEDNIKEPHQYIILLGVDPQRQGQGYGGKLVKAVLNLAEEKRQATYLETHGEKNLEIYKKLGFKLVSEDIVPALEIPQYAMLKYNEKK